MFAPPFTLTSFDGLTNKQKSQYLRAKKKHEQDLAEAAAENDDDEDDDDPGEGSSTGVLVNTSGRILPRQSTATKRAKGQGRKDARRAMKQKEPKKYNRGATKAQRLADVIGTKFQTVTRVGKLSKVLNLEGATKDGVLTSIRETSCFATEMRISRLAFLNFYILSQFESQQPLPSCLYTKEFVHGVQQLLLRKEMTDQTILGAHRPRIAALFEHFTTQHPGFSVSRPHGHLEHASVLNYQNAQLSTCLSNAIVESFMPRVACFFREQLQIAIPTIKKGKAFGIVKALIAEKFDLEEECSMPAIDDDLVTDATQASQVNAAVEALRTALGVDTASMQAVITLANAPFRRDGIPVRTEAMQIWARCRHWGDSTTRDDLLAIARDASVAIPAYSKISLATISRVREVFHQYLLLLDHVAERSNAALRPYSTETTRSWAHKAIKKIGLVLNRSQQRRLAKAMVQAANDRDALDHPPFDTSKWHHLGVDTLNAIQASVKKARKELYWSRRCQEWASHDPHMIARCHFPPAPATKRCKVFGASPKASLRRTHITLDAYSMPTIMTAAGERMAYTEAAYESVIRQDVLVRPGAMAG